MGAATALLHAHREPYVRALVLDSPFTSLPQLMQELATARSSVVHIPGAMSGMRMMLAGSIKERADFDIHDVDPLAVVHRERSLIPALFATGELDDFISPSHCQQLHDAYAGEKMHLTFAGDHHSPRPEWFHHMVRDFLKQHLIHARDPPTHPDGTKVERHALSLSNPLAPAAPNEPGMWANLAYIFGPGETSGAAGGRVCGW